MTLDDLIKESRSHGRDWQERRPWIPRLCAVSRRMLWFSPCETLTLGRFEPSGENGFIYRFRAVWLHRDVAVQLKLMM